jgi:glycosyltransferase involved in cell wall biosynthesis
MISNTDQRSFDVIEVTNEMPVNRIGGVGSVIENLYSGFKKTSLNVLWFLTENSYTQTELAHILKQYNNLVIGNYDELSLFSAPVVHEHSYRFNSKIETTFKRYKTIYTIHSLLAYEEIYNDVQLTRQVKWQEKLIAGCDTVVLISETEKEKYTKLGYQALNESTQVVYNGLKAPEAKPKNNYGRQIIGYCGLLVPRKRPEYVQLILLEKGFSDCCTLIAGKAFSLYAKNLLRNNQLEQRVKYLGWCGGSRLEAFYNTIDVLIIPSTYEPFGMCAIEAASRQIPVVCSQLDGLEEIFGNYAFYFEPDNYPDYVRAVRRWQNAPADVIDNITKGAKERYETYFTDIAMANNYISLFQKLMEG